MVRAEVIEIAEADLEELRTDLRLMPNSEPLLQLIETWRHEPVRLKLERLAEHIRSIATVLGKDPIVVRIEADRTRLPTDACGPFWSSMVHVVRNAVDHGIESPSERAALGKPDRAPIALRARMKAGGLVVEVEDGGRGIDWAGVAERARASGLAATTPADLTEALFHCGLTTRTEASMTSGRGVGLTAARQACVDAGGTVEVESVAGQGTRFRFLLRDLVPTATASEPRGARRIA